MKIELRPEIEKLVQQDVARGPYRSASEFIEHAISMLHEQEDWLADNKSEIRRKVVEGYAAAERGELLDVKEARSQLNRRKVEWRVTKPKK
jgi:putative addiction module CopG family antidote